MRKVATVESWVVYKMPVEPKLSGPNAVCEKGEWEAMQREQPGRYILVRAGIATEAEAEAVARAAAGGTAPKKVHLKRR